MDKRNDKLVVKCYCPRHSPWGVVEDFAKIGNGLFRVETPSHGGFWLSQERKAMMPDVVASVKTFGDLGDMGWYEEDCDWILPVLAFPWLFPDTDVARAVWIIQNRKDLQSMKTWEWYMESDTDVAIYVRGKVRNAEHSANSMVGKVGY